MKFRIFSIFCALLFAFSVCAEEKVKLTLEEARKIALEQNPTMAKAMANIDAALAAIETARSSYYPTLNLVGSGTKVRDYATTEDFKDYTKYEAGAEASWLIFDGFARRFRVLSAELGGDVAMADCDDARRLLLEQVAYAYYNVLKAQNTMEISLQDAEFNRQLKDDAQKKKDYGTAKLSEVLNFEFQVQTAEVNYITAKSSWRTAYVTLGALLNIQRDDLWDSMELVAPQDEEASHTEVPAISELLSYALEHRPDLVAAREQVQVAENSVKQAQSGWYPTLSAFGEYGFSRADNVHFNKSTDRNINFGLSATWNLFNGFATEAAINEAKANLCVTQKTLEALEIKLDGEVRQNRVSLESALEVLEKQNSLLAVAQQIRDLVYEEYQGGTATITRVNEAQTDLTNTALDRSNAWIAVLTAHENLASATGAILEK